MQELKHDCWNRLVEAGGVTYTYDVENTRLATTKDGKTMEYVTNTGGSMSQLLTAYEADGTEMRYYNPDIKRFINQDIKVGDIGSSQSLNRYAYCEGNSVGKAANKGAEALKKFASKAIPKL